MPTPRTSISAWYSGERYHPSAALRSGNRTITPVVSMGSPSRTSQLPLAHFFGSVAVEVRFVTVSPGNTTGTNAASDLPLPMRIAAKYVMPAVGLSHKLDVGAKRLVDGVTDPTLSSGVFYASAANSLTGPMVNQADMLPDLANRSYQDNANEAIHRFIP